jgi:hypothetical protein
MTTELPKNDYVDKEKSEICHISFTFPTVANENFNLAGVLTGIMINPAGDEKKSMTKSMHNGSTTPSI